MIKFALVIFVTLLLGCSHLSKHQIKDEYVEVGDQAEQYLESVARKLEKKSVLKNELSYSITPSTIVQASSFMGGSVDVTAGMLFVIRNEAQLAGLLAHEIGHAALHFNEESAGRIPPSINEYIPNLPFSDKLDSFIDTLWSKKREDEADRFAVNLLVKCSYNPYEFTKLLQNLSTLDNSLSVSRLRIFKGTHDTLKSRSEKIFKYLKSKGIKENHGHLSKKAYINAMLGFVKVRGQNKKDANIEKLSELLETLKGLDSIDESLLNESISIVSDMTLKYNLEKYFFENRFLFMQEMISVSGPLWASKRVVILKLSKLIIKQLMRLKNWSKKKIVNSIKKKEKVKNRKLSKRDLSWKLGKHKSSKKWSNQMDKRGWTEDKITEVIKSGKRTKVENRVNPGNKAIKYEYPKTGKFVVRDEVTKEILQISSKKFAK